MQFFLIHTSRSLSPALLPHALRRLRGCLFGSGLYATKDVPVAPAGGSSGGALLLLFFEGDIGCIVGVCFLVVGVPQLSFFSLLDCRRRAASARVPSQRRHLLGQRDWKGVCGKVRKEGRKEGKKKRKKVWPFFKEGKRADAQRGLFFCLTVLFPLSSL